MARKNFEAQNVDKKLLGELIYKLRIAQSISLRQFSQVIGIPHSNLNYIEKGTNVPTGEIYAKIIKELNPPDSVRRQMDRLYSKIRDIPPPDVCKILLQNYGLSEKIRTLGDVELSSSQLESVEVLFASFKK